MPKVIRGKSSINEEKKLKTQVVISTINKAEEEEQAASLARSAGLPYIDLNIFPIGSDDIRTISEENSRKYSVGVFRKKGTNFHFAIIDPNNEETLQFINELKKANGWQVSIFVVSKASLQRIWNKYKDAPLLENIDMLKMSLQGSDLEEFEKQFGDLLELKNRMREIPTTQIISIVMSGGIKMRASDIHFEPEEESARLRYRIDGVLHDAMTLPREVLSGLVARIKVLSNLKLDEHRLPQDGRFKIENESYKFSLRVSILPVFDGEKIVMRLLDESSKGLTLEKMGLSGLPLETVHREIKKPNGMVLVTGPTGSGKTTTLYTVMDIINTVDVNISTVEDPVEYRMPRVNQTQVNTKIGMTFASALRALLRQDPDIIMVGEIRDKETLEIAIQAAMTGHLVLSTLHTNSAAGALPRMIDMGAEPFLIASTVNVIIAQRLVRKLCPECRQEYFLTDKEIKTLKNSVDLDSIIKFLKNNKELGKVVKTGDSWSDIKFYKAKGCEQCSNEGYHGRLGIFEVLDVSGEVEKMIVESASTEMIEKVAKEKGMTTMVEDGFVKVVQGITSIEEVLRVTKE